MLPLDLTHAASIGRAVDAALERFGGIDVLVNTGGYGQLGIFEEITPEAVERQFAVNVFGTMAVLRAVLPAMRAAERGTVFNLSSIGGIAGFAGAGVYCAS